MNCHALHRFFDTINCLFSTNLWIVLYKNDIMKRADRNIEIQEIN